MRYEKKIGRRIIKLLILILWIILIPALIMENPLYVQMILITILMIVVIFMQKKLLLQDLKIIMKRFGFNIKEQRDLHRYIEDIQNIFESSKLSNRRLRRINRALELSIEINNLFLKSDSQQSVYDFILEKALEAIEKTAKGSILLLDGDDQLRCVSLVGFDDSFMDLRINKEDDFLYKSTNGKVDHSIIIEDVVAFNREVMTDEEFDTFYKKYPKMFQTVLSTPIKVDDTFIGVLNIDGHVRGMFDEEDQFIMDLFASQLEVAIRNRNLLDEILYLSRYDHLTNVYNRKHFDEIVDNFIERQSKFIYVLIDINDLKKVNDVHGHNEGDQLLKIFCSVMQDNIRNTDYIARLGGDEFGMILTGSNKLEASKIFVRVMRELNLFIEKESIPYEINFSYGMTVYPDDAVTAEELYLKSDKMMYKMKRDTKRDH